MALPWYSPTRLLRSAYVRRIRPFLPDADPILYAGIPGPTSRKRGDRRFGSLVPPSLRDDVPGYEAALVTGLNQQVRPRDRVVVVGGGLGITAAIAARLAGPHGHVGCFEGDPSGVAAVARTASRNKRIGRSRCAPPSSAIRSMSMAERRASASSHRSICRSATSLSSIAKALSGASCSA